MGTKTLGSAARDLEDNGATDTQGLRRPLIAGALALMIAMGIGRFAYTPILPAMRAELGLSTRALSLLASANYLGYLVGALLITLLRARWTPATMLRVSLVAIVAVTGLMAATSAVPAWILLRFLAGLASAGAFVFGSTAILGLLAMRRRTDLTGWFYAGVGIGIALSGVVVLAIDNTVGNGAWRVEWLAVTALAALLLIPCWRWLPGQSAPPPMAQQPIEAGGTIPLAIALLGVAYFLEGAGYSVTGTFLVAIVSALPGLADLGAGAWILVGLAAAPSTVLWARAARRGGAVPALVLAFTAQAIGVALPALTDRSWAAAGSAILFGGTFMGITALTIAYAREQVSPARVARVIGALTAAFGLGQVIGPLIAASLAGTRADFGEALMVASGAIVTAALLIVASGLASRRFRLISSP
jgi:predicted MFS family arabinose efflux permease